MSENRGNKTLADEFIPYWLSWANAPINVKPAGLGGGGGREGGRAWGGDLIVVVVPGVQRKSVL